MSGSGLQLTGHVDQRVKLPANRLTISDVKRTQHTLRHTTIASIGTLPMVAAFTTNLHEEVAWRCYSPDNLSPQAPLLVGDATNVVSFWKMVSKFISAFFSSSLDLLLFTKRMKHTYHVLKTHRGATGGGAFLQARKYHCPTSGAGTACNDACSGAGPYLAALLKKCDPGWTPPAPPPAPPCPPGAVKSAPRFLACEITVFSVVCQHILRRAACTLRVCTWVGRSRRHSAGICMIIGAWSNGVERANQRRFVFGRPSCGSECIAVVHERGTSSFTAVDL
jgi:hypothetical protein